MTETKLKLFRPVLQAAQDLLRHWNPQPGAVGIPADEQEREDQLISLVLALRNECNWFERRVKDLD